MNKFEKNSSGEEKSITKQELIESIGEEIDAMIRERGVDGNAVAEIAEDLKNKGLFTAGDELKNEAFRIWRQNLIDEELEKR